jgi:hypothetical protein
VLCVGGHRRQRSRLPLASPCSNAPVQKVTSSRTSGARFAAWRFLYDAFT